MFLLFFLNPSKYKRNGYKSLESMAMEKPLPLFANAKKSFQGSIVLGKGFVISPDKADMLIAKDIRNKDVLFPYLNGDDLNNDPQQKPSRWVINFFDWPEERARAYSDCFEILEQLVRPERQRWELDKNGNEIIGTYALRKPLPQKWWIYAEKRPALYSTISQLDQVMAINRHAKYLLISVSPKDIVYSEATIVLALDSYYYYAILSSSIHEVWAWKNSSTMGVSTLRYSASNAFETFPFPKKYSGRLEELGYKLNTIRKEAMTRYNFGLTDLQNLYHSNSINVQDGCYEIIETLRNISREIDSLVIELYNWNDILLGHDFYEMEYLPENDRVRYYINQAARKEILKRLSLLNHKLHHEEIETEAKIESKGNTKKKNNGDKSKTIDLFPEA